MIKRELKYITFEFDEDTKEFTFVKDKVYFSINKVYAVAFVRFVIRILSRAWYRKIKHVW